MCLITCLVLLMLSVKTRNEFYIFQLPKDLPKHYEPSDNPTTVYGVELGKKLFFEKKLSKNNTISCSSCHSQENAFSENKRFSTGIHDSILTRNSMPLFNLAWVDRYFWDGRARTIEEAVMFPILAHNEMNCDTLALLSELNTNVYYKQHIKNAFNTEVYTMDIIRKSLAQYLRTLTSFNTPIDNSYIKASEYMKLGHSQEEAVRYIFGLSKRTTEILTLCESCHSTITYGNNKMKNNGLDFVAKDNGLYNITYSNSDKGLFKVPSFRNIYYTAPYMHDGRFNTLEEVIEHYNSGIKPHENLDESLKDSLGNPIKLHLSDIEKKELITFFKLLSDTSFITTKKHKL